VLLLAVVVHDHRSAAEARLRADVGVADVGQVIGLHARPEHAVLHLDEVPDPAAVADCAVGPQVGVRAHLDVVADPARLDHAAGLQVHSAPDPRRALDHTARLDQRVGSDLDVHIDVGRRGIDDRDTGGHHAVQRALAHARFGSRKLGARVHPERFVGVGKHQALDAAAVADCELDDRGQVELALRVAIVDALEELPEQSRVEQVHTGVAFTDRELVGRRVGHLDDPGDPSLAVAHHDPGHVDLCGEQHEVGAGAALVLGHPRDRLAAQQRCVPVEHDHVALERRERLATQQHRVAGAALLGLDHELGAAREALLDRLGAEPDHDEAALRAERLDRVEHEAEHRPPAHLVQDLRLAGVQARALAGGEDQRGEFSSGGHAAPCHRRIGAGSGVGIEKSGANLPARCRCGSAHPAGPSSGEHRNPPDRC
jgi:hypothetical protein